MSKSRIDLNNLQYDSDGVGYYSSPGATSVHLGETEEAELHPQKKMKVKKSSSDVKSAKKGSFMRLYQRPFHDEDGKLYYSFPSYKKAMQFLANVNRRFCRGKKIMLSSSGGAVNDNEFRLYVVPRDLFGITIKNAHVMWKQMLVKNAEKWGDTVTFAHPQNELDSDSYSDLTDNLNVYEEKRESSRLRKKQKVSYQELEGADQSESDYNEDDSVSSRLEDKSSDDDFIVFNSQIADLSVLIEAAEKVELMPSSTHTTRMEFEDHEREAANSLEFLQFYDEPVRVTRFSMFNRSSKEANVAPVLHQGVKRKK